MSSNSRVIPANPGFFSDGKPVIAWEIRPDFSGDFTKPDWIVTPIVPPSQFEAVFIPATDEVLEYRA